MGLEEYEATLAEKRAGLNKAAPKPAAVDAAALEGLPTFKRVDVEAEVDLVKLAKGPKAAAKRAGSAGAGGSASAPARVAVETGFRVSDGSAPRGDAGGRVTILSSDKDLMQLVGDGVEMLDPMKNKTIGVAEVEEKFGVRPDRVVDAGAGGGFGR